MSEKQYVILKVNEEAYGVDIKKVKEISEIKEVIKVPSAPEFVEGIINLRGEITPIINLSKRLGLLNSIEGAKDKRIIIVNLTQGNVGFLVEDASYVLNIKGDQIENPPEMLIDEDQQYIQAIAKVGNSMVIILDLDKILKDDEKEELKSI
ncbi:chemotaxis protein CheW [Serpentinicella sp. ANB-PHB4]|uniref:chemotaxis protein CheW n=1 Tax=Serpentinicella sp. ANB-PHB4 TaxID=3074076 RepID=UPI00285DC463|nr:chemotaxis protein CheW [Serpentinicella sp. ANB-PHB4]MDR5657942.1 chemotaxis protein CheW [Serpentinicella sp. ANB-PHB4]